MASSNTLTFDQDPPVRPAVSDVGGGAKENSVTRPPNPTTMATAEDFNQISKQIAALGGVAPLAILLVTFSGGDPSITLVKAPGSNVTTASFTPTDNGNGDTTIAWKTGTGQPAGALPSATMVRASLMADVEIDRIRAILTTSGSDPAARVKTKLGATGTDADFILEIF